MQASDVACETVGVGSGGTVRSGCSKSNMSNGGDRVRVAMGERGQAEARLDEAQDARVIGDLVRDVAALRVRRHHDQRHAQAELIVGAVDAARVDRRRRCHRAMHAARRRHVIVEAALLVVAEEQRGVRPLRRAGHARVTMLATIAWPTSKSAGGSSSGETPPIMSEPSTNVTLGSVPAAASVKNCSNGSDVREVRRPRVGQDREASARSWT